ncbi:MAG: hypothetical protein LBL73_03455 [Synergistaceae bacterium]|jgi:hypothetical protein|nr:hypothetical protein [Synergistaceae bacterium]
MAERIELTNDEQELFDIIKNHVKTLRDSYRSDSNNESDSEKIYKDMSEKAHELHIKLKKRNFEPKHHRYMLKNRGVPVDDERFYFHIHPVEDLIAYVNDPDANNEPEDSTIGEKFDFRIYTRRWGYDHYTLTRTQNGWTLEGGSAFSAQPVDKTCESFEKTYAEIGITRVLQHDNVSYPYNIGIFFELIWDKAAEGADKEAVQKALNDLAEWISLCEKTVPRGLFEGLI